MNSIHEHINELHQKESKNWEGLARDIKNNHIPLKYNLGQYLAALAMQNLLVLEWGRGTGKSTFFGHRIRELVYGMPRSSGIIVGETYVQILTRTLPSTIQGLEMQGLYKNLHYFVGRRPPKSWKWPEPYQPPLKYDNFIIFYNGTGIHLVSQDRPGSGRGLNTDFVLGDEAALLDKTKFDTDVLLTNRGSFKTAFENHPLHLSVALASSTPLTSSGRWFTQMEEQAILNPDMVKFIKCNAFVNKHNLSDGWFDMCKRIMLDWQYDAEVLNIRPKAITDGFYPKLNKEKHCYISYNYNHYDNFGLNTPDVNCLGDDDLDLNKPLSIGLDWGSNINYLVVGQDSANHFNIIDSMFVLYPKILDDVVNDFADYYKHHKEKHVFMWYDSSGNISQANSRRTYAEQARDILFKRGWRVTMMTIGNRNADHSLRYKLWNNILAEENPKYPTIRFNSSNNKELWISMTNTPAKRGRTQIIQKDKSSERKKSVSQQHATHGGDAIDVMVFGKYSHLLTGGGFMPAPILT